MKRSVLRRTFGFLAGFLAPLPREVGRAQESAAHGDQVIQISEGDGRAGWNNGCDYVDGFHDHADGAVRCVLAVKNTAVESRPSASSTSCASSSSGSKA